MRPWKHGMFTLSHKQSRRQKSGNNKNDNKYDKKGDSFHSTDHVYVILT